VRSIARRDPRVRCVQRVAARAVVGVHRGHAGLGRAVRRRHGRDLQHDESVLPAMLELLRSGRADLVVARATGRGSTGDWDSVARA